MLILTRRLGESVIITCNDTGNQIEVKVTKLANGQVAIGFNDPDFNFDIHREEIQKKIDTENNSD